MFILASLIVIIALLTYYLIQLDKESIKSVDIPEGEHIILHKDSNYILDSYNGNAILTVKTITSSTKYWIFKKDKNGYNIINKSNGLYLSNAGSNQLLLTKNVGDGSRWIILKNDKGYVFYSDLDKTTQSVLGQQVGMSKSTISIVQFTDTLNQYFTII